MKKESTNKRYQEKLRLDHRSDAIKKRLNQPKKSQVISDAVLGGIDGCMTTFSVVTSTIGAVLKHAFGMSGA